MKKKINIKHILQYKLAYILSLILLVAGFYINTRITYASIDIFYEAIFTDLFIMGLIIPIYMIIVFQVLDVKNSFQVLLRFKNKKMWWRLKRNLILKNGFIYSVIIHIPLLIFISMKNRFEDIGYNIIYSILIILLNTVFLSCLGIASQIVLLKSNSDIIAICSPTFLIYLPTVIKYIFKIDFIPSISFFMRVNFNNPIEALNCILLIVNILIIYYILSLLGEKYLKKIDIIWR